MRWRPLLPAIMACAITSPALPESSLRPWARFDDGASVASAHAIVASEAPGDAALSSLFVDGAMLVVKGTLSLDNGSRWSTLGAEISPAVIEPDVDLSGASALRIRLGSATARPLRVRIKGGDREIGNAGCYPIVIQMVGTTAADYVIPLSAFRSPGWCGTKAVSIEQTLRSVERVEVTANDEPVGAVSFSVGRIDFLADGGNEGDQNRHPTWSDDFEGERGLPAGRANWQTDSASERAIALDGLGHLRLRARPGDAAQAARTSIRSAPGHPILYGHTEVRLQVPEAATGDRPASLRVALRTPAPGAAAIVLLEGDAGAEGFMAGLDGPGPKPAALKMRTPVANLPANRFVTVGCDWEPDRIRWLIDGNVVQEAGRGDLPASAWAALEQEPLALEISVDGGNGKPGSEERAAWLIDSVRYWQRDEPLVATPTRAAAPTLPAARIAMPASAAAPRRKPVAAGQAIAASAATPSKRVVCEHSARYELMLCY